jgi:biopolymer transport protein ExbD
MAALTFDKPGDTQAARVSFVPMIDVVLQIICFYLFVSAGVQAYQETNVELPTMVSPQLTGELPAELTINISAEGTIDVNGRPIELAELREHLSQEQSRSGGGRFIVAIRCDRRQVYGVLDGVLQACRDAQISPVTMRAVTHAAAAGGGAP